MLIITRSLIAGLLVTVLGCVSGSTVPRSSAAPSVSLRYVLTGDEIRADGGTRNALHAIERLRPWFLERGRSRNTSTAVFVNGKRYYDLMDLRAIASGEIREIRYLTALEALALFGGSADVIAITTGRYDRGVK